MGKSRSRLGRQPREDASKTSGKDLQYRALTGRSACKGGGNSRGLREPPGRNHPRVATPGLFHEFSRKLRLIVRRSRRSWGYGIHPESHVPGGCPKGDPFRFLREELPAAFPVRSRCWLSREVMACGKLVGIPTNRSF